MPPHIIRAAGQQYFQTLPLTVMQMQHHANTAIHGHDFSELVIVLQGSGVHVSPGGEYPIGAGDVFVLHGDEQHGYHNTASLEIVNILFRMDELALTLRDLGETPGFRVLFTLEPAAREHGDYNSRLRISAELLGRIKDRISEMIIEQRTVPAGWQFSLVAQFMLIVSDLCRAYSEMENPAMRSLMRLGDVIAYIHQHYAEEVTLDDLAKVANMSRRTITREFRNALGVSPIDYLIRERVNRAIDLLRYSDATVTETAYRVGFQDSNYFTRKFHSLVGYTPRDARKLNV